MEETTQYICVMCPKGCSLQVTHEGKVVLRVTNQGCKRGREYAERELVDPRRMVATTIRVEGGIHPLLPVATNAPFPKPRIFELMTTLRKMELKAPVEVGQPFDASAIVRKVYRNGATHTK
jgi:CxxC motif-containing protein